MDNDSQERFFTGQNRIALVSESFKVRLRNAAVEGFLNFIKLGVPVSLLLMGWMWLALDYSRVRVQASRGNAIFEMVQAQQQKNQQQGQQPTPGPK